MTTPRRKTRRRRAALLLGCLAAAVTLPVALIGGGAGGGSASAAAPASEVVPQTDDSIPARGVTLFGSSPSEASNEVWGIGTSHGSATIVRYATGAGWSVAPGPLTAGGQPLSGFALDHPEAARYSQPSPLAGQVTLNGSAVLLGTVPGASAATPRDVVLTRDPGGTFTEVPLPPASEEAHGEGEVTLAAGEVPFGRSRAPLVAALEEGGSKAGALLVPVSEGAGANVESSVLHWNGATKKWSREPIEVPSGSSGEFEVLAIGASSPQNAWLLASLPSSHYPAGSVGLFRRHVEGESASWRPVAIEGGEAGGPVNVPVGSGSQQFTIPGGTQSQIMTVTSEGLWLDGLRADTNASATMYLTPSGEAEAEVRRAWCLIPAGSGAEACKGQLPEALPTVGGRSYAWADSSEPYGQRVISGFPAGVSLRLEGEEFVSQPALGGSPEHEGGGTVGSVGGSYGSAFAAPREGWLGQELLPVHLTVEKPLNRLTPWPVPFRKSLLAVAAAPGEPIAAPNSEALAVGDNGEVARYKGTSAGWVPESLLGPGGKFETPRLRAVAWPRANRAYAVGDFSASSQSQMWLWRGETGLWEPDPATPQNFRGNLLGIAFQPGEPARGYAVGEEGTLLGYGKTWQQETLPSEPACTPVKGEAEEAQRCSDWKDVTFTSVAFAGAEAIVAYRILPSTSGTTYRGGLLVNGGSGWHVDQGAASALGDATPYAVAGLPDGGAAFSATGEGALIYEREGAGAGWRATATEFPGRTPGSLSLFREGGALRVIASGVVPDTLTLEREAGVPVGQPPELLKPYPIESSPEQGVLRQTATGWSDEEHELNNAKEVPGEYTYYDTPYQPDPVQTVLVSENGEEGWAVGGWIDEYGHALLETSDVERYRGTSGKLPEGFGTAPVSAGSGVAVFAVGGDARCEAPCAVMRDAGIGPDRWLSHALSVAGGISGMRAFLYTGPRVTTGSTAGPATIPVPWLSEEKRYEEALSDGVTAYPTASETDAEPTGAKTETSFLTAFGGLPFEEGANYAEQSEGAPPVRVIEVDETGGNPQLAFVQRQLAAAAAAHERALVLGSENLAELDGKHVLWAEQLTQALVTSEAAGPSGSFQTVAAYLFDAPEENVDPTLSYGGKTIPSYGSGTLGYVDYAHEEQSSFDGASGFMLLEVGQPGAAVTVRLVPNIAELAIEAQQGTLLRRSSAAYFQGLGRRPRSGNRAHKGASEPETDPYVPIPSVCSGPTCATGVFPEPEFTFSSSDERVGKFVEADKTTVNKLTPKLNAAGEPIADDHSGLFCALNAGRTTVTLTSGGLSASVQVEVQAGSARRPCGTTPLSEAPHEATAAAPPPAPAPAPATAPPTSSPLPISVPAPPPAAAVVPAAKPRPPLPATPPPFFVTVPPAAFIPAFVPPPIPTPARPTPPSGTSAVSSQVEAAEREEEEEAAPESVSAEASAYSSHEHEPSPVYILGIVTLAAFAGASVRKRTSRRRRGPRVAPATINTMRAQRRIGRGRRF